MNHVKAGFVPATTNKPITHSPNRNENSSACRCRESRRLDACIDLSYDYITLEHFRWKISLLTDFLWQKRYLLNKSIFTYEKSDYWVYSLTRKFLFKLSYSEKLSHPFNILRIRNLVRISFSGCAFKNPGHVRVRSLCRVVVRRHNF